jgi:diphosphomevalonate decarboxylase
MLKAIKKKDFELLGSTAEANALAMHECMRAATPPLNYFEPETEAIIKKVQALRKGGLPLYLTIDAGPNVKLLYLDKDKETIKTEFNNVRFV